MIHRFGAEALPKVMAVLQALREAMRVYPD